MGEKKTMADGLSRWRREEMLGEGTMIRTIRIITKNKKGARKVGKGGWEGGGETEEGGE
jgi:hypothetical protein